MTSESGGTKYGDRIADDHWEEDDPEPQQPTRTTVRNHEIEVYYDDEPEPQDNYDRTKYTVTICHDDETREPYVLRVIEHRWKGNYWRDTTDLDWRDTPRLVRERVASVMGADRPQDLDCGTRMFDEGGESRFEKYHKPRIDATTTDEMWASSSLGDALSKAEAAAERLPDGSEGEARAEAIVDEIVELKTDLQPEIDSEDGDSDGE